MVGAARRAKAPIKRVMPRWMLLRYRAARHTFFTYRERLSRDGRPQATNEAVPFRATKDVPIRFLIGTGSGLLLYDQGSLSRVIPGPVYGVTRGPSGLPVESERREAERVPQQDGGTRWYASRRNNHTEQIVTFVRRRNFATDVRPLNWGLDGSVHQIDAPDSELYVAETGTNCVVILDLDESGTTVRRTRRIYPAGKSPLGALSANYAHINSVLADDWVPLPRLPQQDLTDRAG